MAIKQNYCTNIQEMIILAIKIQDLTVRKDERQVRDLVNSPQGAIEIYEPTVEDLAKIIDLQAGKGMDGNTEVVSFEGTEVIKNLFPLLTNIDMTDLSDEEIKSAIDNPSVHLLIAQQLVAQIVQEANKLYLEQIRTGMMESDSMMGQVELMNAIPAMIMEKAKGDGKVSQLVSKVEQVGKELEEALAREQEEELKPNLTLVETTPDGDQTV
jgi:hypothetical protein